MRNEEEAVGSFDTMSVDFYILHFSFQIIPAEVSVQEPTAGITIQTEIPMQKAVPSQSQVTSPAVA